MNLPENLSGPTDGRSEHAPGGVVPMSVAIFNPLPHALHHYVNELQDTLGRCGVNASLFPAPGVEGVRTAGGKVRRLLAHIRSARAAAKSESVIICVWPVLGWYELALWSVARARKAGENLVIIHDPTPLRNQVGLNRRAAWIASVLSRGKRPTIATHSSNAARIVTDILGLKSVELLHPILTEPAATQPNEHRQSPSIGVFGQYKPSRDVELLSSLPTMLTNYKLKMAGTGWPSIVGWEQEIRFLTEDELTASIMGVDVVLIPNTAYYQSGIAIRALELSVPVVGAMTPFLLDLYGDSFPGIVEGASSEHWVAAIHRTIGTPIEQSRHDYQRRVDRSWLRWFEGA